MSSIPVPALERGSLVLVTGVSGYIGSHVADQLLAYGYRVRGTVRDVQKAAWTNEFFAGNYGEGHFESIVVPDMAQEDAFEEAVKDVSGVAHVATILSLSPNPEAVIAPTIAGLVNALKAASQEPTVRRFVYTSSSAAMSSVDPNASGNIDHNTWNSEAVEAAWSSDTPEAFRPVAVYAASKTLAEQEAWKYMKEQKPAFTFNTVLPCFTLGKVLDLENQGFRTTSRFLQAAFEGKVAFLRTVPTHYFVNVQDVARLHVVGLADPEVENERILAFAAPFTWSAIFASLRRVYPNKVFPERVYDELQDRSQVPTGRAQELLRRIGRPGWMSLDDTCRDWIACNISN